MIEPRPLLGELKNLEDRWQAVMISGVNPSLSLMISTVRCIKDAQKLLHIIESSAKPLDDLPPGVVRFRND